MKVWYVETAHPNEPQRSTWDWVVTTDTVDDDPYSIEPGSMGHVCEGSEVYDTLSAAREGFADFIADLERASPIEVPL